LLSQDTVGIGVKETVDLLLWYGFLGVVSANNEPDSIYDRAYAFVGLKPNDLQSFKTLLRN
jgi:hypothetical protein